VIARYSKTRPTRGRRESAARAATPETSATDKLARRRGRPPTAARPREKKEAPSLSEAVLKCVSVGATTAPAILGDLQKSFGMKVRPNHLGIALRHRQAGRLEQNGEVWSTTSSGEQLTKNPV
jgi:hypothetical protein